MVWSVGKLLPSLNLKLGAKTAISASLLIVVNTALVVGAVYWSLTNEFGERALRDIEVNLRTLTLAFSEQYKGARVTLRDDVVSHVEINEMPDIKDHAIVDRAVSYVGGNATLFVYDDSSGQFVRRSTNVKKENGDRAVGTQLAADHPGQTLLRRGEPYKGPATLFGNSFMTAYFPIVNPSGKVIGVLYVGIPMAHFEAMLTHAIQAMALMIGSLSILLLIATCVFSVVTIARPIRALTRAMLELADGNFAVVLPGLGRKDEIGEVAQAVETFKVKAEEKARSEAEAKVEQDQIGAQQRKAEMDRLAAQFETAVGEIVETVSSASNELEASAGTLTSTADHTQQLTMRVASAFENASSNVQSVASATEELSSSISEISRQVQESAKMAGDAAGQARSTTERVSELSKAAARIGDVVELINTIAGQTNLLALNATIEAARAGEAGRGFAVVASEVKALAEQTAKATGEIGQQINGIQAATEDSVSAIREISAMIEKLSEVAGAIAAAVEEQGAATQDISRNVQQAAHGTQQASSNITDVQRGAGETGSACSQVLAAAKVLSSDSSRLRLEVGKFLQSVRTA